MSDSDHEAYTPAPAAVMFSGGTDSTLAAALMLEEGREVHLMTYNPGFVLFLKNSGYNADRLKSVYGAERVHHHQINNQGPTRKILWDTMRQDIRDYGFNMNALICLGCRMAMHAGAITHCLEHGIPYLVDGSIADQATIPEQLQSTLQRHRDFYRDTFGINHRSPIYDESRSDKRLVEMGMTDQKGLKKQFILFDTQGTCPLGVTADVYARMFYRLMPKTRERESAVYGQSKYPLMEKTVREHFPAHGLTFDQAVARLRELKRRDDEHANQA